MLTAKAYSLTPKQSKFLECEEDNSSLSNLMLSILEVCANQFLKNDLDINESEEI